MEKVEIFLEWAKNNGWEILKRQDNILNLPENVLKRYPKIPNEFLEFLKLLKFVLPQKKKT